MAADYAMRVCDLIAVLQSYPQDAAVYYEDGNFGGKDEPFTMQDIQLEDGLVLIRTPYWEAVD